MNRCTACKLAIVAILIVIIALLAWYLSWYTLWVKAMNALGAAILAGLKAVGIAGTLTGGGIAKVVGHVLFGFAAYFSLKFVDYLACQICKALGFCEECPDFSLAPP